MPKIRRISSVPQMQTDATITQANPVSGTKYTVLDTVTNARIIAAMVNVEWTVQPTPLELHITIDGTEITHTIANPVSTTNYLPIINGAADNTAQVLDATTNYAAYKEFLYEGRTIKVTAETTGGTTQALNARIKYAKW